MQMQADGVSRRDLLSGIAGAAVVAAPALANAEVEYPNVPYLGGSDQVMPEPLHFDTHKDWTYMLCVCSWHTVICAWTTVQ